MESKSYRPSAVVILGMNTGPDSDARSWLGKVGLHVRLTRHRQQAHRYRHRAMVVGMTVGSAQARVSATLTRRIGG
jgi:hypothetical protein